MPKGGARVGAGAPLGNRNRAARREPDAPDGGAPRPAFQSGRDFALWVLNAPDADAPMEVKVRAMQSLISAEGKQPAPASKQPAAADTAETAMGGRYAPRRVRGFGVVEGGK